MKLDRLPYTPSLLVDFYAEALTQLGALCERTWHDRLEIVAEGRSAKLWTAEGTLHALELSFASADASAARDAAREVFPGCPLTFKLAENIRPSPLPLERLVLGGEAGDRPPDPPVTEKLWRAQFPETSRWRLGGPFKSDFHFALVGLARCEVQAIAQHWSLHRVALALPGGDTDEALARELTFAQTNPGAVAGINWPVPDPARWQILLQASLEADLASDLASIGARQENYLRRELERIDDYFDHYQQELSARATRSHSEGIKLKTAERLAAAKAEHARRRSDQVARHEIRVVPHWDALLLIAEPAWRATLAVERARVAENIEALFVPRARRWFVDRR
ncbi:MAG TPA: hypothetical protein VN578_23405 [Candidatus Binatia bacterium]|jgi:hypothetical protein|nr:hypothetical protein [Candidatus Binatia bacterium]